ncbi:translocation/assembly module TamB domain-containing protein [uncultured Sphingomonas sp.]|uniref:translocation/assembly module TamB domain-containing protein n=1 Tax=uncultured Sphingomonas sp. TaxID=158754 RepID=UPI0025EC8F50|nr:translocation/assembly module TamB domain-containing protein [uncultured Sphingomonas sp.]
MTEETDAPPAVRSRFRWGRAIAIAVSALVGIVLAALGIVDTSIGHRWVADRIATIRTPTGLRFSVGRIDGSLYSDMRLVDLRVYDLDGLLVQVPQARLDWRPLNWARGTLDIRRVEAATATLYHVPHTRRTGRQTPILPDFDIRIDRLRLDRLVLARRVLGRERVAKIEGRADIRDGRAVVTLNGVVAGSDRLRLHLDARPDYDRFDLAVEAWGAKDGVLAKAVGVRAPVTLNVAGGGRWSRWDGLAKGRIGGQRAVDLRLSAQAGRYALSGQIAPSLVLHGRLQRLTAPRVIVAGQADFADRRLNGALVLRSPALRLRARGVVDLGASRFEGLRVDARLVRPEALFLNMSGQAIAMSLRLDGAFDRAAFDYRLAATRFAFDRTGFEDAVAAGKGRLQGRWPLTLPIRFTATRVTGVGEAAGGILLRLSAAGELRITPREIMGQGLALRSDKLAGRLNLRIDLTNGRYDVGLDGALQRYLIPGLGIVDVTSRLTAVPGPDGHGTRVVGRGEARVRRLDNAFLRSLAGGLPHLTTDLERGTDGVFHFHRLVLTGPDIRLTGEAIRRRDGTFHFVGGGRQRRYGPVQLVLDGRIDKPTLDLLLAAPNAAMGLSDVRAHLDPTDQGFAFRAAGGSRLGPFQASGAILLPRGQEAVIQIQPLLVAGARATGALNVVAGGFAGRMDVSGGGLSGELLFRPVGEVQRIEAHLAARQAEISGVTVRQGRVDLIALLDPAGASIEGTANAQGLRRGALYIAQMSGTARMRGGNGEVKVGTSGSRGRAFSIQTVTQVSPDRFSTTAQGTLDRRPLQLLSPAIVTRDGDGWALAPTRLSFAGGEAKLAGRFDRDAVELQAGLTRMPLAVLDIGYPGLGLGGTATGTLTIRQATGAPTGKADLTIRGLTRAGLVLTSRPIDMGVAGVLSAERLGVRAVMASGGKIIGRGQALIVPGGAGDWAGRMQAGRLIAQLRYAGPADTLWRLTGVEMFDLSGPVAIGADVTGSLNQPVIRGAVKAVGARIESATTGTVLTDVQATGRFGGSRLVIDRFAAQAGKDGRVSGTGQFDFAAAKGVGLDLALNASNAVMIARDDIGATVTGPLTFHSDGAGGTIGGDVVLNRSRYRLGRASAATAVPQLNIREINIPGGGEEDDVPRKPWTLAVKAHAPNGLIVSGLGLNSEWSADLKIGGTPDNPAITGQATLIRGDYEFAGRDFDLARGIIRFGGEVPANPALDIAANANVQGLSATIRVTGTALKPEIGFSSTPALPNDELLSRLLFGTSIASLSAPEALQLAAAVAALQDGGNGLNPINAVRRAAGLDRLRVLPADVQIGRGTSVAAGKYITRRFYAEIITDGQGYSATQIEFQVTRWLSLLSSISTLGRQNVNVRISKDY